MVIYAAFRWDGPPDDIVAGFGMAGDIPVIADWNGDGQDNIGVFRNGFWILDYNGNYQWDGPPTDIVAGYGMAGDMPVAIDYNGDGLPEIGIFRADFWNNNDWIIDNDRTFAWEGTGPGQDLVLDFGITGDKATSGDWNGDGQE